MSARIERLIHPDSPTRRPARSPEPIGTKHRLSRSPQVDPGELKVLDRGLYAWRARYEAVSRRSWLAIGWGASCVSSPSGTSSGRLVATHRRDFRHCRDRSETGGDLGFSSKAPAEVRHAGTSCIWRPAHLKSFTMAAVEKPYAGRSRRHSDGAVPVIDAAAQRFERARRAASNKSEVGGAEPAAALHGGDTGICVVRTPRCLELPTRPPNATRVTEPLGLARDSRAQTRWRRHALFAIASNRWPQPRPPADSTATDARSPSDDTRRPDALGPFLCRHLVDGLLHDRRLEGSVTAPCVPSGMTDFVATSLPFCADRGATGAWKHACGAPVPGRARPLLFEATPGEPRLLSGAAPSERELHTLLAQRAIAARTGYWCQRVQHASGSCGYCEPRDFGCPRWPNTDGMLTHATARRAVQKYISASDGRMYELIDSQIA